MSSEHTAQSERNVESENRSHFDKTAASYDAVPGALGLAATAGKGIRDHYPSWNPQKTRVMEFASGTGLVSRELVDHAYSILGVDISQGMVDYYNKRFADMGYPSEKVHSIIADLKLGQPESVPDELRGKEFDVIFCSMAYHHFVDINSTTQLLASFLAPGGTLIVINTIKTERSVKAAKELFAKRAAANKTVAKAASEDTHGTEAGDGKTYGVVHIGGISDEDIRTAFASAAGGESGLDMDTYAFIPFANSKIWDLELELFLAKASRK